MTSRLGAPPMTAERFWAKVLIGEPDECWPYLGWCDEDGYGDVGWHGRHIRAHRLVSILLHGPIPAGIIVLHICDNPPCCNPRHLRRGTHADNMRDKMEKGRFRGPPRKLTELQAASIRPEESSRAAAYRLGVHHKTIARYRAA